MHRLVFGLVLACLPLSGIACTLPGNLVELRTEVAQGWNDHRTANGRPLLAQSPVLQKVAQDHACDNATRGIMTHTGGDGSTVSHRLRRAGYAYRAANENIGLFRSAVTAVHWWMRSDGHRRNMLANNVREFGIGVAVAKDGKVHWVVVSGSRR